MKSISSLSAFIIFSLCLCAQDATTFNTRGFRQACRGNYIKAIKLFTKAIRQDDGFTDAYYNRALAFSKIKNYSGAIADYTKAISIRPKFRIAYNNRGAD